MTHPPTRARIEDRRRGPVFVSYRHELGHAHMVTVRRLLHTAGVPTWIDQRALFAGNLENNIGDIIRTRASGAVLILTANINRPTLNGPNFVWDKELPTFCRLVADFDAAIPGAPPFWAAVVNTVRAGEIDHPDKAPEPGAPIDLDAPARLLGEFWETLQRQKLYRVDTPEAEAELIREVTLGRVDVHSRDEVLIAIQSRPQSEGGNALDADFYFQLDSDENDVTRSDHVASWCTGLSAVSAACYQRPLRVVGGTQPAVAIALGAQFNEMRVPNISVHQIDLDATEWRGSSPTGRATGRSPASHRVRVTSLDSGQGRGDVAVFLRGRSPEPDASFEELVDSLPLAAGYVVEWERLEVSGGPSEEAVLVAPEEADALAEALRSAIRDVQGRHGGRVHLCFRGPFPLALLTGRSLNTFDTIVYDLAKIATPDGIRRSYRPVALVESNGSGPARNTVRPVRHEDLWPEATTAHLEIVNLTPHDVTLFRDGLPLLTWPVVTPSARLEESARRLPGLTVTGRRPDDNLFIRMNHTPPPEAPQRHPDAESPVQQVRYGGVRGLPHPRPGVGYLVSRVLADAVRRPDLYFPDKEVRDGQGQIVGCEGLGQFPTRFF